LQTVEALRAAITENPSASLKALRANVDCMIAAEAQLEASELEVQSLSTDITSLQAQISLLTTVQPQRAPLPTSLPQNSNMFSHPPAPMVQQSAKLADPDIFPERELTYQIFLLSCSLSYRSTLTIGRMRQPT